MVASLEDLAEQIGISNAIMGVTLSAAGTSLPAYIASRIAGQCNISMHSLDIRNTLTNKHLELQLKKVSETRRWLMSLAQILLTYA